MGAIAGPLASAAVSFGAQKLFGKGSKSEARALGAPEAVDIDLSKFRPDSGLQNFSFGGFQGGIRDDTLSVLKDPRRIAALQDFGRKLTNEASAFGRLREQVAPGFGRLTDSRVQAVQDARRKAIGNLRDNLSRRRVLGSSFGADALSRAEAEFGKAEGDVRAQSFLEELDATTSLLDRQTQAHRAIADRVFQELDFESELGANLAAQTNDVITRNNSVMAQLLAARANLSTSRADLAARSAEGRGSRIGSLVQPIASAAGKAAGDLFRGGGGAAPAPSFQFSSPPAFGQASGGFF